MSQAKKTLFVSFSSFSTIEMEAEFECVALWDVVFHSVISV